MAFGIIIACSRSEPNLPRDYVTRFIDIDSLDCTTVLVLPEYACIECTRFTYDLVKEGKPRKNFWIITDDVRFREGKNVIIDTEKDRIVRYNPFVSRAYFVKFRNGRLDVVKSIGSDNLDSLQLIYSSMVQCP